MIEPVVSIGPLHAAFPMGDPSRVGEARRHAAQLAARAGLDETQAGRLALVVTELGTNLLRHAKEGQLLLAARPASGQVEVIAIDRGPGIPDVARSLNDGFSTGGTPGTGLGAVRRLSQEFDLHSAVPDGTLVLARVGRATEHGAAVTFAGISIAAPGETVGGDAWAVAELGTSASVMVVDGLGHGPDAAKAAHAAVAAFEEEPLAAPCVIVERAHTQLRTTRGAALSLLRLDPEGGTIRACGAGNVVARIFSGVGDKSLLTQHGTVGLQMRRAEETTVPWPPHAVVVVHSDGLESRWSTQRLLPLLGRDPSLIAALLLRDHCRGRDDATVVVLRRLH